MILSKHSLIFNLSKLSGACSFHIWRNLCELLEILLEICSKDICLMVISIFICPGVAWNKNIVGNIGTVHKRMKTKDRISNHLDIFEIATNYCANHRTRIIDIDAVTDPKRTACPASVNEITSYLMFFNTLTQQVCVLSGL